MAVFTEVPVDHAAALAERLGLGPVLAFKGIVSGIENTNYFLTTARGAYVLTLFERLSAAELPFYLHLMKHLAQRGIPVPEPQADANGELLHSLCGKPAAVVDRLRGHHELQPSVAHVAAVGTMLARMHRAALDYPRHQPNLRGLSWWSQTVPIVRVHLAPLARALIDAELAHQQALATGAAFARLPRGPVHADLFRDNVMFEDGRLCGFFDFYFAGVDVLIFDVAVCLNDWCIDLSTGALLPAHAQALVAAYDDERTLSDDEIDLLPELMRAAALRFWTSRLWDFYLPREASMLKPHDPTHFERVLEQRRRAPWRFQRPAPPRDPGLVGRAST